MKRSRRVNAPAQVVKCRHILSPPDPARTFPVRLGRHAEIYIYCDLRVVHHINKYIDRLPLLFICVYLCVPVVVSLRCTN